MGVLRVILVKMGRPSIPETEDEIGRRTHLLRTVLPPELGQAVIEEAHSQLERQVAAASALDARATQVAAVAIATFAIGAGHTTGELGLGFLVVVATCLTLCTIQIAFVTLMQPPDAVNLFDEMTKQQTVEAAEQLLLGQLATQAQVNTLRLWWASMLSTTALLFGLGAIGIVGLLFR